MYFSRGGHRVFTGAGTVIFTVRKREIAGLLNFH